MARGTSRVARSNSPSDHKPSAISDPQSSSAFVRGLGVWDATAVVAGSMIGSGIFIVSADIARQVGAPGWLLVVWIITGLMTLANIVYLAALPLHGDANATTVIGRGIQFAQSDRVATAAMEVTLGQAGSVVMAAGIMISTFGCENGLILAGARVYWAMARHGLFFPVAGLLNARGVPGAALVLQGIWAAMLTLSGTYSDLLDYVIFAALLFYVLTVGGIFILRRSQPDAARPYRAVGYPLVPAFYMVLAALIMIDLLVVKPRYTWPGLLIVASGVPVFFAWQMRRGRRR
jgi:APA family basic amino acid/polyamine antiporter